MSERWEQEFERIMLADDDHACAWCKVGCDMVTDLHRCPWCGEVHDIATGYGVDVSGTSIDSDQKPKGGER